MGEFHAGAGEACAKLLQENVNKTAGEIVEEYKTKGKRVPGFGHKVYEVDPRTQALAKVAHPLGFHGKYVNLALEIQNELEKSSGKKLPLNIDGMTAALISEMGFDYRLGKSFFAISRIVGLAAHVFEEQTTGKPVRRISSEEVDFVSK
jgi:citryl-CoA lyase